VDIITIFQAVFRRWYVSLPVMLLAAGIAVYVQNQVPPAFQATGQIMLASPELDPSGLPTAVVDIDSIVRELDDPVVREDVTSGDAVFQAEIADPTTINLAVSGPDASAAEQTAANVRDWLRGAVEALQEEAGIPEVERLQVRGGDRSAVTADEQAGAVQAISVLTLFDPAAGITNPFVASNTTVRLLVVAVESDAGRASVQEMTGPGVDFTLSQAVSDAAPILQITTTAADPDAALGGFDVVAEAVDAELQRRQDRAEIPDSRRTRVEALARPQSFTDVSPPVDRSAAAIFGLGGLIAVAGAILVDSIVSRRTPSLGRARSADLMRSDRVTDEDEDKAAGAPSGPTMIGRGTRRSAAGLARSDTDQG
jgi:hypothetical protein